MEFTHFQHLVDSILTPDETGGFKVKYATADPAEMHPLVLAYIGDAYFNLYVRGRLLAHEQRRVQIMHRFGAQIVSAVWQTAAYHGIEDILTEDEQAIFRRGRNARSHVPKSATVTEYRISTGFEALLGALYVKGDFDRLEELAGKSFAVITSAMVERAAGGRRGGKRINERKIN